MGEVSMLSGTLVDIRPRTLLHFLGLTGKTGVLRARGHDHDVAVRLEHGCVTAGEGQDVVSDVVELLRLGNGEFAFEETATADGGGEPLADVLARADEVLAEWEDVSQAVPSVGLVVALRRPKIGADDVLSDDAWAVVVEIAAGRYTPDELARSLGWSLLRTCRAVKELADQDRAELLPPKQAKRVLRGRGRAVLAKAEPRMWHAADRPLWPGAGDDESPFRRSPWDDPGE
jgi:hypothetical protein